MRPFAVSTAATCGYLVTDVTESGVGALGKLSVSCFIIAEINGDIVWQHEKTALRCTEQLGKPTIIF